jgi:hypothetical protein
MSTLKKLKQLDFEIHKVGQRVTHYQQKCHLLLKKIIVINIQHSISNLRFKPK